MPRRPAPASLLLPVLAAASLLAGALSAASGCSVTSTTLASDSGAADTATGDTGAAADATVDADAAPAVHDGPGETGDLCSFNDDCRATHRCECTEADGCGCAPGKRGTGRNGVDPCTSGDQCSSAICVEGPTGAHVCSGACATEADCTSVLPLCSDIQFVGRICIRSPD